MRLIDADTICEGMVEGWQTVLIKAQVDNAPTVDAVVVTRCKDCKYLVGVNADGKGISICRLSGMEVAPNDFCSRGEK